MILITGATGHIGGEVVRQVQAAQTGQKIVIRAMVRNPAKAVALADSGVEVVQGDFGDEQALRNALQEIDDVFLTVPEGPTQFDLLSHFLNAAQHAGRPHLIMLSGAEAAADSPRTISQWHWRMQQQIIASALPYTFLQPVYIMQNVLEFRESIDHSGQFFGPITGDLPFSMVSPHDIAAAAGVALTQSGHEGKAYVLTGSETLSFDKVAQAFHDVLQHDVHYIQVPRETAKAQLIGRGQPDWLAEAILSMLPPSSLITDTVAALTGVAPLTLRQYLEDTLGRT